MLININNAAQLRLVGPSNKLSIKNKFAFDTVKKKHPERSAPVSILQVWPKNESEA